VLSAGGAWSEPERIAEGVNSAAYRAAVAPDGALCFVWLEVTRLKSGSSEVFNNILRVKRYRDGAWQDTGEVYDYGDKSGGFGFNFAGFQIAFDPEGALHVLFSTVGTYGFPETRGLFLDGEQLTVRGERGLTEKALVPEIGKTESAQLAIGGDGVFHLIGMDTDSLDPDSLVYAFDRCVHSLSRDGGRTWEGPFTVFDGDCEIVQLGVAEDGAGVFHMMACRMTSDQPTLLTTLLRPPITPRTPPRAGSAARGRRRSPIFPGRSARGTRTPPFSGSCSTARTRPDTSARAMTPSCWSSGRRVAARGRPGRLRCRRAREAGPCCRGGTGTC